MMLSRLMLIASVVLWCYSAAMILPSGWLIIGTIVLLVLCKRGYRTLTAYGTARWADRGDLQRAGMFHGNGLILGRFSDD